MSRRTRRESINELTRRVIGMAIDVHKALGPGLLVENKILIEIKSVEGSNDIHMAQTLTYIKLGKFKL